MPSLIAVKQRKVLQGEDAGATALMQLIGAEGLYTSDKPETDYPSVCSF